MNDLSAKENLDALNRAALLFEFKKCGYDLKRFAKSRWMERAKHRAIRYPRFGR